MKSIILIAPPAAGKGTEAAILKERYNIPHISTGDLLRKASTENTEEGLEIKEELEHGALVEDDIVVKLLRERILEDDCKDGYILDGFPRTVMQARIYENMLKSIGKDLGVVIYLNIDKETARNRIIGRISCPKCGKVYNTLVEGLKPQMEGICDTCHVALYKRTDDTAATFDERFNTYVNKTSKLIDYYKAKGVLNTVDSSISKEHTDLQVERILKNDNN